MTALLYAASILTATVCLGLLDHRFGLVLWSHARRAGVVLVTGIVFFLVWDVVAIAAGFYRLGESTAMTGLVLAPDLPVEELMFIAFLCYVTLVLRGLLELALTRRAGERT